MIQGLRRWLLIPALLFLGAGLVNGGADLPRDWGVLMLGVPLALLLMQFFRPTELGWRLAFFSFCLLVLTTVVLDLTAAIPRGLPPLSASAEMVALFALQFGVPAWLIWLARLRRGRRGDETQRSASQRAGGSGVEESSSESSGQAKVPPNHPLQLSAGPLRIALRRSPIRESAS